MSPQRSSFKHFRIFIASRNGADGLVSRELKYLISCKDNFWTSSLSQALGGLQTLIFYRLTFGALFR
jgi:hypothetical protein